VRAWVVDGLVAGAVAGAASVVPSAVTAGARPWWHSAQAAGNLFLPTSAPAGRLLAVGTTTRALVALNWGVVLSRWLDRRHPVAHGAVAGLALFGFQYGLLGRRRPLVQALPAAPQLADHLAYGVVAGLVLGRRRLD